MNNKKENHSTDNQKHPDANNTINNENKECTNCQQLTKQIEQLKVQNDELNEKLMRLAAEFDNFRKRTIKEKSQITIDAVVNVVNNILPIVDNINRALMVEVESDEAHQFRDGLKMILTQVENSLEKIGVHRIDCILKSFDPNLHEAIMHIEDNSVDDNTVVEELIPGYVYKDKVIRHSIVKVAN